MKNVLTLVLGGGQGTRLYPLTKYRSKPAVPVAGKYRLIDIPLSNCINSGLNRCYVLTQFNSVSLHRHIRSTYTFDPFDGGFVEVLAAQQTLDNADWYQGTADAVRQNLRYVEQPGIEYVLILSGDQLYRMSFQDMLALAPASRRRRDDRRRAGPQPRRLVAGDHAGGRQRAGGRLPGEAEDRTGTEPGAHRSGLDRRPRHPQRRPRLPGQHGHLSLQPRHADRRAAEDRLSRFRQGGVSGVDPRAARAGPPLRRLLGGHRHDQVVLRGEPGAGQARRPVRPGVGRGADLLARPVLAPHANRRRHRPRQPGGRRLDDRGGGRDREQRDRPALPHRPQRDDPQFDRDGQRLLRNAGVDGRPPRQRRSAAGRGRRLARRRGDHRQELPHRPQHPHRQRAAASTTPKKPPTA